MPWRWTLSSVFSTRASVLAIAMQLVALFRSLRIEDQAVNEYRKTVRWFIASVILMLVGLLLAAGELSFIEPA